VSPQNPAILYAAIVLPAAPHVALYKTRDGGTSWVDTGPQAPANAISLTVDPRNPNTLYASTTGGIFKSTDGGARWNEANSGLGSFPCIGALAIDPSTPNTLYSVRCDDGQIFKSVNGGGNWGAINLGWEAALFHVLTLVADPQSLGTVYARTVERDCVDEEFCPPDYPERVAAGPGAGLFKSVDGGQSWAKLPGAAGGLGLLTVDSRNGGTLYALGGGLLRSTDGGASWNVVGGGVAALSVSVLAVDGQDPTTVYAASSGGVAAITLGAR
jgi:photosystem II stability/assembly factor-like uncharacterized protein